jgi:sterol desaturase/sphingolipid hydroxylase (fatty acid hydroxylase superfamily)
MLTGIINTLAQPFLDISDQRALLSYLAAVVFLFFAIVLVRLRRRKKDIRLGAFWRLLTWKTVWLHRSAKLDYKLYALNTVLLAFVLGFFTIGSNVWASGMSNVLTTLFGPAPETVKASWWVIVLIATSQILALDFGYWAGHAAMHKSPLLWEFHKVHHSAEVMTPATEFRQHPVELILMPCCMAFTTGIAYAIMAHIFGSGSRMMGSYGYNLINFVHLFTFHHLRHSHINMPFTGIFGRILHSPMHHIIHHSDNPKHFDRNMGYMLSIWDWMAGTLYVPKPGERVTLGIGHEGQSHNSVGNAIWLPFRNAGHRIYRGLRKRASHLRRTNPGS